MAEDKQAIEAIAKDLWLLEFPELKDWDWETISRNAPISSKECLRNAQTLTSLGYVKLAEQKLPPYKAGRAVDTWIAVERKWYEKAQQDMLAVDSEGCAYRRVKVNG